MHISFLKHNSAGRPLHHPILFLLKAICLITLSEMIRHLTISRRIHFGLLLFYACNVPKGKAQGLCAERC